MEEVSGGVLDLDVLGLHHLGEGLLHAKDGEPGGGATGPAL